MRIGKDRFGIHGSTNRTFLDRDILSVLRARNFSGLHDQWILEIGNGAG
jgi:hypothetical protein